MTVHGIAAPGVTMEIELLKFAVKANVRAEVREAIERHLRHEPEKVSRSRIKRLSGLSQPQYRWKIGQIRVFYDVVRPQVQVLAIVFKEEATKWLSEEGRRE